MPRMKRDESLDRQRFAIEMWKRLWKDLPPGKSVPAAKVNKAIFERYGSKMRGDTLYSLRDQAIKELRESGYSELAEPRRKGSKGPSVTVGAGQAPAPLTNGHGLQAQRGKPVKLPRPASVVVSMFPQVIGGLSGLTPTQAVKKVFETLETGLRVEHAGEGYVLINKL